jgi:hypothetical protein
MRYSLLFGFRVIELGLNAAILVLYLLPSEERITVMLLARIKDITSKNLTRACYSLLFHRVDICRTFLNSDIN